MIIKEVAKKDTYVTNLHLGLTDATYSNVGKASTLDLFKIAKENKKIKASALLTIENVLIDLVNNKTFTLTDYENNSSTFIIDSTSSTDDGSIDGSGRVIIGIDSTSAGINQLIKIKNAINNTNNIKITATSISNSQILLEQNSEGESGEKSVTVDSGANLKITSFIRIQHSALLINFDLDTLKQKFIASLNNSVFSSINNYKVFLKLFDVGNASTRPKDYDLKLSLLNNNVEFEEGIGSDIYNFSDLDYTNFSKINNTTNWTKNGIVTSADCVSNYYEFKGQSESIARGDEDVSFDITSYFNEYLNNNVQSSNFILCFDLDYLFDNYTYFVKRFGSVQLNDKMNHPRIEIHIDENQVQNIERQTKKRYFDNEEIFYLYNKVSKLENFNENYNVKLRLEHKNTTGTNLLDDGANSHIITGFNFYDFKGNVKKGIKKFTIPNTLISRFNTSLQSVIQSSDTLKVKFNYYYDNEAGTTIDIRSEEVIFNKSEVVSSINAYRNLSTSIKLLEKNIVADDSFHKIVVDFIDINKEHAAVNIPLNLTSEDLGKVYYSMHDIDTGRTIIKRSEADINANEILYDGSSYIINFFASKIYKNKRVNFKFYYNDEVSLIENVIFNKNFSLRFD